MIGEFIRYATTFAPERVRKFGYLQHLIALEFRAKRCADAWAGHQRRSRNFIVKAADLCEKQNLAVIVGSGLLLEVPINTLSERFDRVILVDIFHMPQVRREAKRFFNVKLLTGDVTGVFAAMKEHRPPGPNIPAPPPRLPNLKDADLIVSCNCLTQLAAPFTDYFEKTRGFSDLDSDKVAYHLMENHAKALAQDAGGVAVLITDSERFAMQGDKVVSRTDLLKAYRLPPTPLLTYNEEWDWVIAPHPEEHPSHDYVHTVSGRIYKHGVFEPGKEGEGGEGVPLPPELEAELVAEKGDSLSDITPER
jgi:hypothetical protein